VGLPHAPPHAVSLLCRHPVLDADGPFARFGHESGFSSDGKTYTFHLRDDVVGLDSALIMPPAVWAASGHLENFNDPLVECQSCKRRFRADDSEGARRCPICGGTLTEPRTIAGSRTEWISQEPAQASARIQLKERVVKATAAPTLTLQLFPEPRRVAVKTKRRRDHELPVEFRDKQWMQIISAAGPDRVSGGRWSEPYAREYFRCVTDDGMMVWLYRDGREKEWYLHGWWGLTAIISLRFFGCSCRSYASTPSTRPFLPMRLAHILLLSIIGVEVCAASAQARVVKVEILSRADIAGTFGSAGTYERITGRVYFAFDPKNPENRKIVDLDLAPPAAAAAGRETPTRREAPARGPAVRDKF